MMKCPDCGGELRVYRTYQLSDTVTRHYRRCRSCSAKYPCNEYLGAKLADGKKDDAIGALLRWGVSPGNAQVIASREMASVIRNYSRNLVTIMMDYESQNGSAVKDPAGFLVWVINTHYPIPIKPEATRPGGGPDGKDIF